MPLQMLQFTNRIIMAMGNTYPMQLYSDPTPTTTNPAYVGVITAIAVDAFGVVTITLATPHGMIASQLPSSIVIANVLNPAYNGVFTVLNIPGANSLKVISLSAIGQAASSGGTLTVSTVSIISIFTTAYPTWATGVTYLAGDIVVPTAPNGHYYTAIQSGVSAAAPPAFPTATGAQVPESSPSKIIWQEAGLTNATAPPPPAASHIRVFAGSLWAWNTWNTNTANGLDGPTSLRMSDSSNPNSWNPINQAFLDKDDGTEGTGIEAFTISGFGIPPEGSLVAFKQYAGYQIVGVFGSPQFLIQRIKSNLGCIAPRTIQFTTGFGLTRFTHLGFAVFDGMNDRIIDEEIRPYVFPSNNIELKDIVTVDYSWVAASWASQTAYPPMFVCAMPIGNSSGKLTRIFCYDLVLKGWIVVDLPFAISTVYQAISITSTPVTVLGTFDDGAIHRWQAGDSLWDNSIDSPGPAQVKWSVECPLILNKQSQGGRLYCRQIVVRGQLTDPTATVNVSIELQGELAIPLYGQQINYGQDGTFSINAPVNEKVTNFSPIISGAGAIEVSNVDAQVSMEKPIVPGRLT